MVLAVIIVNMWLPSERQIKLAKIPSRFWYLYTTFDERIISSHLRQQNNMKILFISPFILMEEACGPTVTRHKKFYNYLQAKYSVTLVSVSENKLPHTNSKALVMIKLFISKLILLLFNDQYIMKIPYYKKKLNS